MELNHQFCYAAIKSRDARFDGRFFTGVLTTGIYCRPICPAITPKAENVEFYVSATAAEKAGFRPCLRCRPESSPGTPDWEGTSATVSRGLRLISEGLLDEFDVEVLAERLHIGPRQLRRLFVKHLGAPPIAVAQTRRLHFAKKLIDETTLPMTDVAFSAGFSSIRRFNAALHKAYGKAPTELRKIKKGGRVQSDRVMLHLKLAYRPPFDWQSLIDFLKGRAIPGVEAIEGDTYRRTVCVGEATGIIEIEHKAKQHHLLLRVPAHLSKGVIQMAEKTRRLFDLTADPTKIATHLQQDACLAPLLEAYPGLRVPGAWNRFEIAVRAILGQQVSVKAATTISGRLVKKYGTPITADENQALAYLFPRPAQLAEADLANIGLTAKRAEAVRTLAKAVRDTPLLLETATTLDEAIERLTPLPGIGDWTAHYIAMRALGEPDAFPAGDLILRRVTSPNKEKPLTQSQLIKQAKPWQPWRAYAAVYLWKGYGAGSK